MRSFWSDPFLWIHLAGFAALPLWLELCWLGLAAGDPVLPFWLELLVVAAIGIVPIFWMQWQRPFYIFSLIAVVLKPAQLTEDQRRLLTLFKAQRNRFLAIAAAVIAFLVLRQLYYLAPIAAPVTPFTSESRWLGLIVTAVSFLGVNLFLQVPVSVLSVMLTGEATFTTTTPYPLEQIRSDFTLLGIPVNQILPPVLAEPEPVVAEANLGFTSPETKIPAAEPAVESISQAEEDWLEKSVTPTTIPDGELERTSADVSAETIRTEEDLETDLWDVETPASPDSVFQDTVPPSIELEEPIPSGEVINSTAIADSETPANSEIITDFEEPTDPIEMVSSQVSNSEELTISETISSFEEPIHAEEVDNSETIADPEEPISSEAIANSEASIQSEVSADSAASTASTTSTEVIIDSEEPVSSEAIADSAASTNAEISIDPVETINPEMVASAPTEETTSPDSDPFPANHQAPEDHKE